MLNSRNADFRELVWTTVAKLNSRSAPRITDTIIAQAFPATVRTAEAEGADKMLRVGVLSEVKRILAYEDDPENPQYDFNDVDPVFARYVTPLKKRSYFVGALGEYVPIPRLIAEPKLLEDACKFMRRKGQEALAEAMYLEELYSVVTSKRTRNRKRLERA